MNRVTEEIAEQDVNRWLDTKKFSKDKRQSMKETIKEMVGFVKEGNLIISDDGKITQVLNFEIGEEDKVTEFQYQNRISVDDIHKRMTGSQVKAGDADGRIRVYVAALTKRPYALIGQLDSTDWSVASTIASFFF